MISCDNVFSKWGAVRVGFACGQKPNGIINVTEIWEQKPCLQMSLPDNGYPRVQCVCNSFSDSLRLSLSAFNDHLVQRNVKCTFKTSLANFLAPLKLELLARGVHGIQPGLYVSVGFQHSGPPDHHHERPGREKSGAVWGSTINAHWTCSTCNVISLRGDQEASKPSAALARNAGCYSVHGG